MGYQLVLSVMRPGLKNGGPGIYNHFYMEKDKYFEVRQTQNSKFNSNISDLGHLNLPIKAPGSSPYNC